MLFKVTLLLGICASLAAAVPPPPKGYPTAQACGKCPAFWVPFQGSCYRVFGNRLDWADAEESCKALFNKKATGHLVSIQSEDENRFVSHLWDSSTGGSTDSSNRAYWIGLSDIAEEGTYVWSDSDTVASYTNWKQGEPNNAGNEDCGHVTKSNDEILLWNDTECYHTLSFVCELPQ
ncbi:alpha-N-acetylgalactosamine-specific lectin-like [Anneissia japonica]|uniref:alpha-N-acetylgalactosamine-specific lectin-like n=1 Tax=Anneissia japonica TaxID=1529436 RepID=UPI001425A23B|nr:alpha-N-acetylgalactosamine-specific lectin-like [Anneissia japonica]